MLVYLLKSGVCLAIFYGFYKLLLEKESIHTFKRYYLLASVVLAFIIPFITFTEYIEVAPKEIPIFYSDIPLPQTTIQAEPINYIPIILWSIYGIGVLLFSIKFFKNLSQLFYKIKHNTKVKVDQITNVLLQDLIVPHTFFDYIFLNKQKFETQQIPKEVLLHEETHAKQKHSLDVLFIEILQILFWFNPLIYFIKHSIKLNHEFLADHAVLKQGIASSTYQNILLAFSSPDNYRDASNFQLANAINYSSIKKRFTVMKTHTSKQAFWLRSLILLPLLAILIYSFSQKQVVEKPYVLQIISGEINQIEKLDKKNPISYIYIGKPSDNYASKFGTEARIQLNDDFADVNQIVAQKIQNATPEEKIKQVLLAEENEVKKKEIETKREQVLEERKKAKQQKTKTGNDIYIAINEKGNLLVNKSLVEINDLKRFLNDLTKGLTKEQKDKILVNLVSYKAPDKILTRVKSILRESMLLKINITKTQEKVIEMPMDSPPPPNETPEQKAENKKIIDDYVKKHPESYTKIKTESGEIIEIVEIPTELMPPPPPPPAPILPQNPSKELLEAKKKYDEKGNAYGEAMQVYFKEEKGNLNELKKQYKEVMELYNTYRKLAEKENVLPPPPPPGKN